MRKESCKCKALFGIPMLIINIGTGDVLMHYRIYPSFFMLQYLFSPMITWSTTGMSIILPDLTSLRVTEISCLLGSGSPLGWLWTRMIDAQGYLRVSAKTSRGGTMAADIEPMEIVGVARSWCFMLYTNPLYG